jgi:hypothetical protein
MKYIKHARQTKVNMEKMRYEDGDEEKEGRRRGA